MSSEQKGGFFQFPLCLLATREPMEQWLTQAFHHAVVEFIDSTSDSKIYFPGMKNKEQEAELARVAKVIGFNSGSPRAFIEGHQAATSKINMWKVGHGSTFNVRLKTSYYFEMRDASMLSERDFRVLVGLYSMVGPKSFAKVGWPMIQARAAGHMRPSDGPGFLGPVYSRGQIERACAELLDRKFIASVTYNRGERFWSHRLSADELAAAVTSKKTTMIKARQARAELNAKTSTAISQTSLPLITCSPPARDTRTPRTSRTGTEHVGGHVPVHAPEHVTRNALSEPLQ
jgi:hypothetical protein